MGQGIWISFPASFEELSSWKIEEVYLRTVVNQ